ncbi:MAG: ATP-binding protein [Nitrospiraceae bacterium]
MDRPDNQKNRRARWGLKGKLILAMLLVGVVPLLIGLVMAFLQGSQEIREVNGASFEALATETARKLDLVLSDEIARTSRIANDPFIVRALEERRDRLQVLSEPARQTLTKRSAAQWEARDPAFIKAVTEGRLATLLRQYYTGSDLETEQSLPIAIRAATRSLYVTDLEGVLVASINTAAPYHSGDSPWWQGTFNKGVGKPYVENLAFDDKLGVYAFTVSLPVMDGIRYQAIGVVHRVYDAKEFLAPTTHPIRFGKTGHAMLIDSDGTVLSCPILPTGVRLADPDLIPLVTQPQPGWVKAPSDGHGGRDTSIIGFATLPETSRITRGSTGRQWHTFVWQSSEELFAPVKHLLTWISVFGLVAVGLLVSLGYVAAGRIVTPIRRLQEIARLIGRGALQEPIRIKTGDEIEDLADEIARMNAQLEVAFAGLTDQVELKTREVQYLQKSTDQILDGVPTPIIMLDQDLGVQYINRASKDTFSLKDLDRNAVGLFELLPLNDPSRERLRGEFDALVHETDHERDGMPSLPRELRDPLAPQRASVTDSARKELHIGLRVYRYEWFQSTGRPGEGQRIGLVLRDTTDESRLQDQLIQAEKLGSLGVLSAGIGHELNNPLFGILGLGEAIQDETDLDQVKSYARDIVQHGKRMATTIRDFTGLARAEGKDRQVQVDLNEQLDQALKLAQLAHGGAALNVQTKYQPLPKTHAVPEELRQVFLNIIANSVQAMQGKGLLALFTEAKESMVVVTIRDSGPGIPKPYLAKIFDPFFTTKGQGSGTGLGLTVANRIITKYGGRIQIESEEGHGTLCLITIPVHGPSHPRGESA